MDLPGNSCPTPLFAATGISVRKDGTNNTRGFTRQQAYALCSVAVDMRISQTVDVPNLLVSALIPLDIFV